MTGYLSAPDLIGEVYGVRCFTAYDCGVLDSTHGIWRPGPNRALCNRHPGHNPPEPSCACGLYGYYGTSRFETNGVYGSIVALVKGWGRVAVAQDGWRAEWAEVVAIADSVLFGDASSELEEAAYAFGVPLAPLDHIDKFARAHTVPPTLRPGKTTTVPLPTATPISTSSTADGSFSRDDAELAELIGFSWLCAGAGAAISLGASPPATLGLWVASVAALGAFRWWSR